MQSFKTLGQPLLGENEPGEKGEEKKKNAVNRGHFILPATATLWVWA
jgi:hypothetical protein